MTNVQLYLAMGIPSAFALVGILVNALRGEMHAGFTAVRSEMSALRTELQDEMAAAFKEKP
jgi:hypothetical protein